MLIIKMSELPTFTTPRGVSARKLLERDGLVLMQLLLKPNECINAHTTPQNVVFYVVKGKGVIIIGNEERQVEKDELIYSPKDLPHGLKALPDEEFHVLVWSGNCQMKTSDI